MTLVIHRTNGETLNVPVNCAVWTPQTKLSVLSRRVYCSVRSGKLPRGRCGRRMSGLNEQSSTSKNPRHLYARRHSKGVFFRLDDLPERARTPGPARTTCCWGDRSQPTHTASKPTAWAVLLQHSKPWIGGAKAPAGSRCRLSVRPGQHRPPLWTGIGHCGNLTGSGPAPLLLNSGYVEKDRLPENGGQAVNSHRAHLAGHLRKPNHRHKCRSPTAKCRKPVISKLDGVTLSSRPKLQVGV